MLLLLLCAVCSELIDLVSLDVTTQVKKCRAEVGAMMALLGGGVEDQEFALVVKHHVAHAAAEADKGSAEVVLNLSRQLALATATMRRLTTRITLAVQAAVSY